MDATGYAFRAVNLALSIPMSYDDSNISTTVVPPPPQISEFGALTVTDHEATTSEHEEGRVIHGDAAQIEVNVTTPDDDRDAV